jgi:hypothetical protein
MKSYNICVMKRLLISLIVSMMLPLITLSGQGQQFEKLNAYKIGFFTKRLDLTSKEAEKFWPAYNLYQDQKNKIQIERRTVIRDFNQSAGNLSDNQLTEMGDKLADGMVRESALSADLHKKLKEILPPEKVIRFYQAENQYKALLLNELQGARQQQKQKLNPDL